MNEQQGVYWHQGMFLQPQHFQQSDRNKQHQLGVMRKAGQPHLWGVGELVLNKTAINNRLIEVESARLIFPDATCVEAPANALISPRSFDASLVTGDKPFKIYLGLRKLNSQQPNVTLIDNTTAAGTVNTRFITLSNPPEVADIYSSGPMAPVLCLIHVLRIFFENETETLDDYDLIPIACLERDGDTIRLSETFIAPSYSLAASPTLFSIIKEIRDELAGRARQLQEFKSPREMQKAEFDANYMVFLMALRSLNRTAPYLYHLTESPDSHPWYAYGALRQLIGELSSFSERFNMIGETEDGSAGLPQYDHNDLGNCFSRARVLISYLLNEISVGPEFLAVLELQDGFYTAQLPKQFFGQRNRFYLVLRSEAPTEKMANLVPSGACLASLEEMPKLIAHALPGVELIHMPVAPQGLPRRSNSYYFRIEQQSQQWDSVEKDGTASLYWLDAPDDLKAEIVVIRR